MATINVSSAGQYAAATKMFASSGGTWVEVPLGGAPAGGAPIIAVVSLTATDVVLRVTESDGVTPIPGKQLRLIYKSPVPADEVRYPSADTKITQADGTATFTSNTFAGIPNIWRMPLDPWWAGEYGAEIPDEIGVYRLFVPTGKFVGWTTRINVSDYIYKIDGNGLVLEPPTSTSPAGPSVYYTLTEAGTYSLVYPQSPEIPVIDTAKWAMTGSYLVTSMRAKPYGIGIFGVGSGTYIPIASGSSWPAEIKYGDVPGTGIVEFPVTAPPDHWFFYSVVKAAAGAPFPIGGGQGIAGTQERAYRPGIGWTELTWIGP